MTQGYGIYSLHAATTLFHMPKPENIFFTASWKLVIGDFGVAINLEQERPVTRTGTGKLAAILGFDKAVRMAHLAVWGTNPVFG